MGAYACPETVIPCVLNQPSKTEHTCHPRRGRCPHRPAIWDVWPARSKREMPPARKNEPLGRRTSGSMRASTPTRVGNHFCFIGAVACPGLLYPAFSIVPANPKHPARPHRGRCPHRSAIWDVRPARSKRRMPPARKNEPLGRRTSGSMRASTPTRGGIFSVL